MSDPKTTSLLREWESSVKAVDEADRSLSSAKARRDNARNNLAKWLIPSDAKIGETFNVWINGRCLSAKRNEVAYFVEWRPGKSRADEKE